MKVEYISSSSAESLKKVIDVNNKLNKFNAYIVLGCDGNQWQPAELEDWLREQHIPVFGAVFPQIIFDKSNYEHGFIVVSLTGHVDWVLVDELSNIDADYDETISSVAENWERESYENTIFVLADGMASRIASLIEAIFFNFGLNRNFVGGGAGSLSFEQKACILCPDGFVQDVALMLCLPLKSGIGVAHGWQPISNPMKVTKSDRNIILEIDHKDAFEQYKAIVEQESGTRIMSDNFFDVAKSYPFGIIKLDAEMVVRDPLMPTEDGKGLICVGEVPEECFVKILHGTPRDLIDAAGEVKQRAYDDWNNKYSGSAKGTLFIDCISRVLFLEEQMSEEIAQVSSELPLFGALTLGEIANNGQEYLEFYNKTAVLCVLGEG
jgi:hypothetical protein